MPNKKPMRRKRCKNCKKILDAIWFTAVMTEEWIWTGDGYNECSARHSLVTDPEQNVICQAARRGISLDGATIYTRMTPCRTCAMLLINSGIKRIYCERKYHTGAESEEMFKKAKIKIEYLFDEEQEYSNKNG